MSFPGIYVGVDNGLSGAAVAVDPSSVRLVRGVHMPAPVARMASRPVARRDGNHLDSSALLAWIMGQADGRPVRVLVEEPAKGQRGGGRATNANAMTSTFCSYGRVLAAMEAWALMGGPVEVASAPPTTWQRSFWNVKGSPWYHIKGSEKPSVVVCVESYPGFAWEKSDSKSCRGPHDGVTDAYLIGAHACRTWGMQGVT